MDDLCSYVSHPAMGDFPRELAPRLPLQEGDLPKSFVDLADEQVEKVSRGWWQDIVSWLSDKSATRVRIEVAYGVRLAEIEPAAQMISKGLYEVPWSREFGLRLFDLNPELVRVWDSAGNLLLAQVGTWDGVTIERVPVR